MSTILLDYCATRSFASLIDENLPVHLGKHTVVHLCRKDGSFSLPSPGPITYKNQRNGLLNTTIQRYVRELTELKKKMIFLSLSLKLLVFSSLDYNSIKQMVIRKKIEVVTTQSGSEMIKVFFTYNIVRIF